MLEVDIWSSNICWKQKKDWMINSQYAAIYETNKNNTEDATEAIVVNKRDFWQTRQKKKSLILD